MDLKKLFSVGNIILVSIMYFFMKWISEFLDWGMSTWWIIPMGFAIKWAVDRAEEQAEKDKKKFKKMKKASEDAKRQLELDALKEEGKIMNNIVAFLKKEKTKLPASDIDFQLKIGNVNLVKKLCEEMYRDKKIGRTGNYRYFV